jgi:ATP-dependent RNA helicase RhlE
MGRARFPACLPAGRFNRKCPQLSFASFGLIEPLLRAVAEDGYEHPTPIQVEAIPHLLAGKDMFGCAQTGTGKTAAFALPILQRLHAKPPANGQRVIRALIVTPTRELAAQIDESFADYGRHTGLRHCVVYGGVRQGTQVAHLKRGVDILVATPGRLLDLMGQGYIRLNHVEVLVLDEGDRMLDMGFIRDIRRIAAAVPAERQTMLFSATIPLSVKYLAASLLKDPVDIRVTPETPAAETVDQTVYFVEKQHKQALLQHLLASEEVSRALVFARTKKMADRVVFHLQHSGINAEVIHSDRTQKDREDALEGFKNGTIRVLVASDIASRGLDVEDISHVINFDMPQDAETYVHRIGRTGRAGQAGRAVSFCDMEERDRLREIERLLHKTLPAVDEQPFPSPVPRLSAKKAAANFFPKSWRRLGRGRSVGGRRR